MPALIEAIERVPANGCDPFSGLPRVPVERRSNLTQASFQEFVRGAGRPVIITDATLRWPARKRWSFEFFAANYGNRRVIATPNLVTHQDSRRIRLSDFILYCHAPSLSPLRTVSTPAPLYVSFPVRQHFPELIADFSLPEFMENCYRELTGQLLGWYYDTFAWIYLGPSGTVTPLHVDHFMTHTISAQISGRKRFLLLSPDVLDRIPEAAGISRDVFLATGPDPDAPVAVHEAVVGEGETLMFPAGWAHHVVALDPSISLSINFVGPSNYLSHLMMISRQLPAWGRRINSVPFRAANRCEWSAGSFTALDAPAC